jgi:lipoic acid synthetase
MSAEPDLRTPRLPAWLKVRAPGGERYARIKSTLRNLDLHTVCEEARCPNVGECWGAGTATIMVLGDVCTRGCRFCSVTSGNPGGTVDPDEPENVARAVARMGLDYVVMTMVDRDDLSDGGAAHVAECVRSIKRHDASVLVEVLSGDWAGDQAAIRTASESGAEVMAHNIETVRRLTPAVRDARCGYDLSLDVLRRYKALAPEGTYTKSSIMVGVGERPDEVLSTMDDLREVGVDLLTLGQYLRPTKRHLDVAEFVHPDDFERYRREALARGFRSVASGPLVRSSYRAGELLIKSLIGL